MRKLHTGFVLSLLLFLLTPKLIFAESNYVLPYPSAMPGSIFYKVSVLEEKILKYWYFGDFGQFTFNLKESDKYLVEAKTLLEYKQYLLGFKALQKSDLYFEKIKPALIKAQIHGKNISQKSSILRDASQKHIEELSKMKSSIPEFFEWKPEKDNPTKLYLWRSLSDSIKFRKSI